MNASINGILLTKADRVNRRINEFEDYFLNLDEVKNAEEISKEDFKEFLKTMKIIVTTELTEKGVERKWKK